MVISNSQYQKLLLLPISTFCNFQQCLHSLSTHGYYFIYLYNIQWCVNQIRARVKVKLSSRKTSNIHLVQLNIRSNIKEKRKKHAHTSHRKVCRQSFWHLYIYILSRLVLKQIFLLTTSNDCQISLSPCDDESHICIRRSRPGDTGDLRDAAVTDVTAFAGVLRFPARTCLRTSQRNKGLFRWDDCIRIREPVSRVVFGAVMVEIQEVYSYFFCNSVEGGKKEETTTTVLCTLYFTLTGTLPFLQRYCK